MGDLIKEWERRQHEKAGVLQPVTARELQEMELPELEYVVDKILPKGVAVLAAKPKRGKSMLALDMCLSICNGFDFLGYKTKQGACLYFDIESSKRRPKDRMDKMLKGRQAPDNLYFITMDELWTDDEKMLIGAGFEQQLANLLTYYPEIQLVVIDILAKVRQSKTSKTDDYERDYRDFGALIKIANDFNVCILCVMHNTKMEHADPFDDIQGSAGVMGSLDTAMVIQTRNTTDNEAALHIRGRDIEEQKLIITFDRGSCRWMKRGTAEEVERQQMELDYAKSNVIKTVFALLGDDNTWTGSATDIKTASVYNGTPVSINVSTIGVELMRFRDLLGCEGVTFSKSKKSKKNIYTFVRE